ncbi:Cof-type HAD-IIB family hydrolase [Flavobacterium gawalongense]|uniref:HAD family phosphatase n=1 Tax=Flavobacterium gawalongense TaxID=2594432 RepID=A0A553BQU8_9FLAO|nr:Cof-type HAD-IIB family hydrolase [Flavobacterium gawalongense]TRW99808.1 HAD family phosphatase [Flavobacterium gawalongense]TRX04114.1 HAD family phosphatase [Flavobacterium gawalongense]TRX10599.1 HAD family phosphatase [Flavobacterium gawalongense]TRX11748.1 HAD family phosphatase [Flavobacterium gawalongense]TRX29540.1 HAD family phosphatase [Flavobacterium gawalongense]
MKYKMLVLDMDDTLLADDHTISNENKEMLLKAQELGVHIILASGRPTPAMTAYAKELQLHNSYMISYNGAVITDLKEDKVIFEQTLTQEQIHDLYDYSLKSKTHIITYLDGKIVSETDSEYIEIEKNITGLEHNKVLSFKDEVKSAAVKCILLEEPSYLKQVEEDLKIAMPHLSVSMSKPFFLEVAQNGIDKGASIKFLAEKLNILQSEIIAVGNAGNDLTMIQYAGLGVWVDNVDPKLRDKGDVIVASNNNHGVAEVVRRFILN